MSQKTLFARLGGMPAVEAAVDIFYQKVLADDSIKHFFASTDMKMQRNKQKAFLAYAFGAPLQYSGKNMKDAHSKLVENGLNDSHFDAVMGHLGATLKELNVPDDLIGEAAAIAESVREHVLGRSVKDKAA